MNPHPNLPTAHYAANPASGRDFVIGDLHGHFDTLEHALEALAFEPDRDRLFSVGDLIDRGPRSADALEWLAGGRFAGAVRGNHEQMMVNALIRNEGAWVRMSGPGALWLSNGADWWYDSQAVEQERNRRKPKRPFPIAERWLTALRAMPYMMTIDCGAKTVGVVHAPGFSAYKTRWTKLCKFVEEQCAKDTDERFMSYNALEFRLLWPDAETMADRSNAAELPEAVPEIDLVITGHSPRAVAPMGTAKRAVHRHRPALRRARAPHGCGNPGREARSAPLRARRRDVVSS